MNIVKQNRFVSSKQKGWKFNGSSNWEKLHLAGGGSLSYTLQNIGIFLFPLQEFKGVERLEWEVDLVSEML